MVPLTILYAALLSIAIYLANTGFLGAAPQLIHDVPYMDKVVHFFLFGLLAFLISASLLRQQRWSTLGAVGMGCLLVAIVATLEECSNMVIPIRNWSFGDLAANYLGVLCLGLLPLTSLHLPMNLSRNVQTKAR